MARQSKPFILTALAKWDFTDKKRGFLSVLIGIFAALLFVVLSGWYGLTAGGIYLLLAIGVVVGVLNIFHEEGILFLISGLAITFMLSVLAGLTVLPEFVTTLFSAVIYVLAPANVVVGLKVLYALATK